MKRKKKIINKKYKTLYKTMTEIISSVIAIGVLIIATHHVINKHYDKKGNPIKCKECDK